MKTKLGNRDPKRIKDKMGNRSVRTSHSPRRNVKQSPNVARGPVGNAGPLSDKKSASKRKRWRKHQTLTPKRKM